MRTHCLVFLLATCTAQAQTPTSTQPAPDFAEAVAQAQRAFSAEDHAATVAALESAILAVYRIQRTRILAALPVPAGFQIEDVKPKTAETDPFAAGIAVLGLTVERRYKHENGTRFDIEVTANSPMVPMLARRLADPAQPAPDGAQIVRIGRHDALFKQTGQTRLELTIAMGERHVVKITSNGMSAEELRALVSEEFVARLEKPLGL